MAKVSKLPLPIIAAGIDYANIAIVASKHFRVGDRQMLNLNHQVTFCLEASNPIVN
ncbi:MAG: hypothetical protein VKJ27_10870 [Synechocystis sp.]|nr:hypothetical protein [Synechocystis sp.]